MRRVIGGSVAVAIVLGTSAVAFAIVPSGRTAVRRVAEKQALDRVSPSPLIGTLLLPGHSTAASVKLDVTFPGTCKAQVESAEGRSTVSYSAGKVSSPGTQLPAVEAILALTCPFVATRNVSASDAEATFEKLLGAWGVDLGVSSLGLLNGRAAIVIGARPRDLSKPQVWVDKATDRVTRVIGSYGGRLWDIQLEDPASIATNRIAQRVTHVWQNKGQEVTLQLMAAEPKVSGPAATPVEPGEDDND